MGQGSEGRRSVEVDDVEDDGDDDEERERERELVGMTRCKLSIAFFSYLHYWLEF